MRRYVSPESSKAQSWTSGFVLAISANVSYVFCSTLMTSSFAGGPFANLFVFFPPAVAPLLTAAE